MLVCDPLAIPSPVSRGSKRSGWPSSPLPMRRLAPVERPLGPSRSPHRAMHSNVSTSTARNLFQPLRGFSPLRTGAELQWLTHVPSAPCARWLLRDPLNTVEREGAIAFATAPALPCISTSDTLCRTTVGLWPLEPDSPQGVPRIASLARCDDPETTPLGPRERTPAVSSQSAFRQQAPHRSGVELRPLANKRPYVDAFVYQAPASGGHPRLAGWVGASERKNRRDSPQHPCCLLASDWRSAT